jgi:uncharacterized membrane protein YjfL (UPF0719 family)
MSLDDLIYWDHSYNAVLLVNFCVVIALFTSLRWFSGAIAHIDASNELFKKDNPAFGVSLTGVFFALTIMLSGTIYGDPISNLFESALSIAIFGIIGIILMALTRVIFDKVALPGVSLRDEIVKGNMAVSIADTGNVIAAAVILRGVMVWVDDTAFVGLFSLFGAYVMCQAVLTTMTLARIKFFPKISNNRTIEDELKDGNIALSLSFAGKKIGTAFAILGASQLIVYDLGNIPMALLAWLVCSVIFIVVLKIITVLAQKIILFGVNIDNEIVEQRNIAVGALKGIIYVALGIFLAGL